jgi:hypothetical protein
MAYTATAKVPLKAVDTAGGILAWANPTGGPIIITDLILDVTTQSTGACTANAGIANDGVTSNNTLMTAVSLAAAGVFNAIKNAGASGISQTKCAANQFVTVSQATGASAGLVGNAYIRYVKA